MTGLAFLGQLLPTKLTFFCTGLLCSLGLAKTSQLSMSASCCTCHPPCTIFSALGPERAAMPLLSHSWPDLGPPEAAWISSSTREILKHSQCNSLMHLGLKLENESHERSLKFRKVDNSWNSWNSNSPSNTLKKCWIHTSQYILRAPLTLLHWALSWSSLQTPASPASDFVPVHLSASDASWFALHLHEVKLEGCLLYYATSTG